MRYHPVLNRRSLLTTLAAPLLRGQNILYRDYSRCLPGYLQTLAAEAYERRNRALAALTTPDAIRRRQAWVRETFWKLAGGLPERTPLNAKTIGSFERSGFRVEKVVYESRPNFHIPALLYIPKTGRPPYPGVLFQLGHSLNGKASDAYQKCCEGLARLGFLVLSFDTMGQGERTYYPKAGGTLTRLRSADEEHTLPGRQMVLVGDTSTRLQAWDAVRSLDYLASHPLADPRRLATTGQSGGGTLSMFLAAVDDRLAAAAVSCGNTENFACAGFNPPGSTDDAEQNFLYSGPLGFDRWDLLYPLAPKPLLVLVSAKDFFGTYSPNYMASGREEFDKLKRLYAALGKPEQVAWAETPLPHNLAYHMRLRIYNWFSRWLKDEAKPIEQEPPVQPEREEQTWVSPSGNVVRWLGGDTPFLQVKKRLAAMAPARSPDLRELLAVGMPRARFTVLGRVPARREVHAEAVEVESSAQVFVPAWVYRGPQSRGGKTLLALEPGGRNARWQEDMLYASLAAEGHTVCVADVRGTGDLNPEYGHGAPRYTGSHQSEEHYAWASMMLGKPLLGQRVTDILALVEALGGPLTLAALGKMTVPALIAAALDRRVERVYLAGGLVSWRSICEIEEYSHPFANFAWRILEHTDLPEIAASIDPRGVTLAGPVDAAGRPAFEAAKAAYRSANVTVLAESGWNRISSLFTG